MATNNPTLTGTEKQIAWAEEIRGEAARTAAKIRTAIESGTLGPIPAMLTDALAAYEAAIATATEATFFIDARDSFRAPSGTWSATPGAGNPNLIVPIATDGDRTCYLMKQEAMRWIGAALRPFARQ